MIPICSIQVENILTERKDPTVNTIRRSNSVKEMDCVEVIVEKEKYAKEGVHKGMQGWICYDKK